MAIEAEEVRRRLAVIEECADIGSLTDAVEAAMQDPEEALRGTTWVSECTLEILDWAHCQLDIAIRQVAILSDEVRGALSEQEAQGQ